MDAHRSIKYGTQLGSRHPYPVACLRVGIGVWLLVLTAGLYRAGHGGQWEWLLVVLAAVHFCLGYRLVRIARKYPDRRLGSQ